MEWGEQQPFLRRTVTGSLSCRSSSPPSRPHARRTPPTTVLSPTWSNFTTSDFRRELRSEAAAEEKGCGHNCREHANHPLSPTVQVIVVVARSLIAFNATVCQKLSRGSRLRRTQGRESGSRRRKGGRGEGRGREQKSSRKVAKTLRRNCAKFVGISAEIRQLPPSAFPSAHRATSFLERRGRARERDEGRTALGDLTYHGNSPGRASRIPYCPRSTLHTR